MMFNLSETVVTQSRSSVQPRAISTFDRLWSMFRRTGIAIWHALEVAGQARATRELRMLADRCVITDPALAHQMRVASEFDAISRKPAAAAR